MGSTMSPKVKIAKGKRVGAHSLARSTLGVEGRAGAPKWSRMSDKQVNYSHKPTQTKPQVG